MKHLDRTLDVIRTVLELAPDAAIQPNHQLREDLGMTSLRLVATITELCHVCDVDIGAFSAEDIRALRTVADVSNLMARGNAA